MTHLVDDLLDVSRITRGKIQLRTRPIDLIELIRPAVDSVGTALHQPRVDLQTDLPAEPLPVNVDPTRIEQVLVNLLNNAFKYSDPGSHVRLSATRENNEAMIRVKDHGIGIDAETLPRVFDLFSQADRSLDRSQGGLGIGLTLVRTLVEMHGGRVEALSDGPGRGSQFIVRLPPATNLWSPRTSLLPPIPPRSVLSGCWSSTTTSTPPRASVCSSLVGGTRPGRPRRPPGT